MKFKTDSPISFETAELIKKYITKNDIEEILKEEEGITSSRTITALFYERRNVTLKTKDIPLKLFKRAIANAGHKIDKSDELIAFEQSQLDKKVSDREELKKELRKIKRRWKMLEFKDRN